MLMKLRHQLERSKTLMIGDRLDTDILFGINGGIDTLMVLTGVNQRVDIEQENAPIVPRYVMQSLGDMSSIA